MSVKKLCLAASAVALVFAGSLCLNGKACAESAPSSDINKLLYYYRQDASVQQLLFVNALRGSSAHIMFYEKDPDSGAWTIIRECKGITGKAGAGKTKEGDNKTPLGIFSVRTAFGIKADPGTKLPYVHVSDDTYACGCELYYNQIIDARETGHVCPYGEHMTEYSPHYNYGLAIDYNPDNVPGLGSAIFIHCIGAKPWTGGCVAMPESDMKYVLEHCDPGVKVIIQQYIPSED
ncbi:MAG: L,D-transpeptidase family protein [bacterium]|nr:L,D-transpeptidase family protein [bacterium]